MGSDQDFYRKRGVRKKGSGDTRKADFPKFTTISELNIAYLHVHLGKQPSEIVGAYPTIVTLADIHLALAHYYQNPKAFESELERGRAFLKTNALSYDSLSLPSVGLMSLVDTR